MKHPHCVTCGSDYHYKSFCPKNRKPINRIGRRARSNVDIKSQFIKLNPGPWRCYLRISDICLVNLDQDQLAVEHVIPKSRGEKYRLDPNNWKPSCIYCNGLKGSRTIESLSKDYPHLKKYLT